MAPVFALVPLSINVLIHCNFFVVGYVFDILRKFINHHKLRLNIIKKTNAQQKITEVLALNMICFICKAKWSSPDALIGHLKKIIS